MPTEKRPPVRRRTTRGCLIGISSIAVLSLASAAALAAEPKAAAKKPDDAPPTVRIALRPAAEPRPALRYRLLPPLLDRQPGNAAVFYNKAALMYQQNAELTKQGDKVSQWNDLPLDKLPLEEIEKTLAPWSTVFAEIGFAVKRQQCDWQLPIHEQMPFTILLPEFQTLRAIARALRLRARWQVAKHQYDDAVETMAATYAMARHGGDGQTLIQGLVGISFVGMIAQVQEDMAGQPGAPNLYWALTWLPRPFIELRRANEFEMDTIYLWKPELRRLEQPRSAAAWRDMFDDLAQGLSDLDPGMDQEERRLILLGKAIQGYPRAKQELISAGRLPEQVEAMPVAQVLLLHTLRTYDDLRDNQFKWMGLPFWQASARLVIQSQDHAAAAALHGHWDVWQRLLTRMAGGETAPRLIRFGKQLTPEVKDDRLLLELDADRLEQLRLVLQPAIEQIEQRIRFQQATNNLKQIGIAMHGYADAHKRFPPAAIYDDAGKPLLSWRVAVLPYLGQEALYKEFHLDEPWDSEHNARLIERMPEVYRSPGERDLPAGRTTYLVPVGQKSLFHDREGARFQDISDGTSNTLLAVETDNAHAVVWTKPDDWSIDAEGPTAELGSPYSNHILVLVCDGSVLALKWPFEGDALNRLVTYDGGEVVDYGPLMWRGE